MGNTPKAKKKRANSKAVTPDNKKKKAEKKTKGQHDDSNQHLSDSEEEIPSEDERPVAKTTLEPNNSGPMTALNATNLQNVTDIRQAVRKLCNINSKGKVSFEHYESLIKQMSVDLSRKQKQINENKSSGDIKVKPEVKPEINELRLIMKSAVGKLSRLFFYPTNKVTMATQERMREAGVDHKCEFAKALNQQIMAMWPKDREEVEWMKKGSWRDLWEGKIGIQVGMEAVTLLKESRNFHSIRACATIGKYTCLEQSNLYVPCKQHFSLVNVSLIIKESEINNIVFYLQLIKLLSLTGHWLNKKDDKLDKSDKLSALMSIVHNGRQVHKNHFQTCLPLFASMATQQEIKSRRKF